MREEDQDASTNRESGAGSNTGAATTEEEALNLMSQIAQQFVEDMKNR